MDWNAIRLWGDLARLHAAERGDQCAFVGPDGRATSFAAFNTRVNQLNYALRGLGAGKGSGVAILARNCTEYIETYGLAKSGMVVFPLNWRLTGAELQRLLAHGRPQILIADEHHVALIENLRKQLEQLDFITHFIVIGPARPGWLGYEDLLAAASTDEPVVGQSAQLDPEDVICVMYTSGTTGAPKGVGITQRGAVNNARTAATVMLKLQPQDRTLSAMPYFHVGGMWYHLSPSFAAGCTTWIMAGFDAAAVLQALVQHRITHVSLVPTMIRGVLNLPNVAGADLSALKQMYYAASPIPPDLLRQALALLPACDFLQSYGSTEAGMVTELTPADHVLALQPGREALLTSCGKPIEGAQVRIVNDAGQTLPQGEIGEIAVQSNRQMAGYWHNDAATQRARPDGWYRMGDLGYFDAEGYLFIVDRKNDMIVTGAENVYPSEVEAVLRTHAAIAQVCVVGLPDPVWVERVVATVVLQPGMMVTPEEIIAHAKQSLAAYKCPKAVFIRGGLPLNALGKIQRGVLREQIREQLREELRQD